MKISVCTFLIGVVGESGTNTVGLHSTNPTLVLLSLFALSPEHRSFAFSSAAWDDIRKTVGKDHTPTGRMLQPVKYKVEAISRTKFAYGNK